MPRLPVRLTEEQKKWVEKEAESRGCSQSDVVQSLVAEARGESDARTLGQRVRQLEERVEAIQSDSQIDSEAIRDDSQDDSGTNQGDSNALENLIEELHVNARARALEEKRRDAVRDLIKWVRSRRTWTAGDVKHEWYPEHEQNLDYGSAESMWENLGLDTMQQLRERGVIELVSRTYRWVGTPED